MQESISEMRAAFEQYYCKEYGAMFPLARWTAEGDYHSPKAAEHWKTWQACWQLRPDMSGVVEQIQDEIHTGIVESNHYGLGRNDGLREALSLVKAEGHAVSLMGGAARKGSGLIDRDDSPDPVRSEQQSNCHGSPTTIDGIVAELEGQRCGALAAHVAVALGALKGYGHGDTAAAKSLQFVIDELMKAYNAHAQKPAGKVSLDLCAAAMRKVIKVRRQKSTEWPHRYETLINTHDCVKSVLDSAILQGAVIAYE